MRKRAEPKVHTIRMTGDVIQIESEYTKYESIELLIQSLARYYQKHKPERFEGLVNLLNFINEEKKSKESEAGNLNHQYNQTNQREFRVGRRGKFA